MGGILYLIDRIRGQSATVTLLKHYMKSWNEAVYSVWQETGHRESSVSVRARYKQSASDNTATRSIRWVGHLPAKL